MRRSVLQNAPGKASGAVHLPLSRVSSADELRVRRLGHLPQVPAACDGAAELLHVSQAYFFSDHERRTL